MRAELAVRVQLVLVLVFLAQSTCQLVSVDDADDSVVAATESPATFSVQLLDDSWMCHAELLSSYGTLTLVHKMVNEAKWPFDRVIDGPLNCTWLVAFANGEEGEIQFRVTSDLSELGSETSQNRTSLPLRFYADNSPANRTGRHYQQLATVPLTTRLHEARANIRGVRFAVQLMVFAGRHLTGNFAVTFQRRGECLPSQMACAYGERECYTASDQCDGVWDCPLLGRDEQGCGCAAGRSEAPEHVTQGVLYEQFATSKTPDTQAQYFRCQRSDSLTVIDCFTDSERCDGVNSCSQFDFEQKYNNRKLEVQLALGYSPNDPSFDSLPYGQVTADEFNCELLSASYRYRYRLESGLARSDSTERYVQSGYSINYPYYYGYNNSGMSTSLVVTLVVTVNMTALFAVLACAFMQRCRANLSRAAVGRAADRLRSPFAQQPELPFTAELPLEPDAADPSGSARGRTARRGGGRTCITERMRTYRRGRLGRYSAYLPFAGALRRAPPPTYDEMLQFDEAVLADALLADSQPCTLPHPTPPADAETVAVNLPVPPETPDEEPLQAPLDAEEPDDADDVALLELPSSSSSASQDAAPARNLLERTGTINIELASRTRNDEDDAD